MRRAVSLVAVGSAVLALALPAPALANAVSLGDSYSTAVKITPGSGITTTTSTGGAVGVLLTYLQPVLDNVLTPLATALTSLPTTMVSDLGVISGNGYTASSSTTAQSPPTSGYPNCSDSGWNTGDCFGPVVPSVPSTPIIGLSSGTVQGYAAADTAGAYGKVRASDPTLTALGVTIGDLGVAESSSKCLTSGACTGTTTLAGVSLLSGTVTARTGSSGSLEVSLNNGAYKAAASYTAATTLTGTGLLSATAQASGTGLKITIGLTLSQLLSALGLSTTLPTNATDAGSVTKLTVWIGTGGTGDSSTASAGGIEVSLGLTTDVKISVLGLATAELTATDTSATGNLVDFKLAYSSAGSAPPSGPVTAPPDLT